MWIRAVKNTLHPFRKEPWYTDLVERARALPEFSRLWDDIPIASIGRSVTERYLPLRVDVPGIGLLEFRLTSQLVHLDHRFQVIAYIPFGAKTLRQCAIWAEEDALRLS